MHPRSLPIAACLFVFAACVCPAADGWVKMFDGKSLDGWKANERPENWKVEEGAITGRGERSHLFWMGKECGNCEFTAEVKINKGGNSGMYFRAAFGPEWPKGYEAQVNTSHSDWRKTGSLYALSDIKEKLVPEETWFTQHIIADGNRITIRVNGKTVTEYTDNRNTYTKGYLALQQHDPGSVVMYRNLMMRELPAKK